MDENRINNHPVLGKLTLGKSLSFKFDGIEYTGYEGDTIASALLANNVRILRVHEHSGEARGIYCNIGHCFECRVTVCGEVNIRACMTHVKKDMVIESGTRQPSTLRSY